MERYGRIIGYQFGEDAGGNVRIYNGTYINKETGKKMYSFIYYNRAGKQVDYEMLDYQRFRAIIDCYDWPKR